MLKGRIVVHEEPKRYVSPIEYSDEQFYGGNIYGTSNKLMYQDLDQAVFEAKAAGFTLNTKVELKATTKTSIRDWYLGTVVGHASTLSQGLNTRGEHTPVEVQWMDVDNSLGYKAFYPMEDLVIIDADKTEK